MNYFQTLSLLTLGLVALSKAQNEWWLQNSNEITIPFVDYAPTDAADYFEYPATLIGSDGAQSTYGVSCTFTDTVSCFGDLGWTSMTLVTGPKTMEVIFDEQPQYLTTGCTLTGTPFPTTGTCSETFVFNDGITSIFSSTTYTVPDSFTDSVVAYTASRNVYTATIVVAATALTSSGASPSSWMTSGSGTTSTSGTTSSSETTSSSRMTSSSGTTPTATTSTNSGTATGTRKNESSTASSNFAVMTAAPAWMLLAGAVAGAAVGL